MQRSTFREKQPDVAWQRQIRDRIASEGDIAPTSDLSLKRAVVRETPRAVAERVILRYEWLGTMGPSSTHYGLFFGGVYCGGVACIQRNGGAGINMPKMFGLTATDIGYLARGACVHWAPSGAASKLIAWVAKLEAKRGSSMLIAYADTDAGEIGTVYQASGWTCIGRGAATKQFVHPTTGKVYDQKISYDLRRRSGALGRVPPSEIRERLIREGWREQRSNPKWRYVKQLNDSTSLAAIIENKRTPYPKRAPESGTVATSDGKAVQARPARSNQHRHK